MGAPVTLFELQREFDQVRDVVTEDYRSLLEDTDKYLTESFRRNFALRQSPNGEPWAGDATLIYSGLMYESLVNDGAGGVRIFGAQSIERGTEVVNPDNDQPYPIFQQKGVPKIRRKKKKLGPPKPGSRAGKALAKQRTIRRRKSKRKNVAMRIPAREFVGIGERDADAITELAGDNLQKRFV
jgi:hypothetical protein